ncbi:hypothetical protein C8J56DRAFT_1019590 [Mycena floridula]|nr:hypothetical protein C8J56DRAFT_1019590 [Mycena floridula]
MSKMNTTTSNSRFGTIRRNALSDNRMSVHNRASGSQMTTMANASTFDVIYGNALSNNVMSVRNPHNESLSDTSTAAVSLPPVARPTAQVTATNNTFGYIQGDAFSHNTSILQNNTMIHHYGPMNPPVQHYRGYIPSKSSLFCGRVGEVRFIVEVLTRGPTDNDSKRARICILGLGGIGKTELVLAVAADDELKRFYSNENLIWISCVPASSPTLLRDALFAALNIPQDTHSTLNDILIHLRSSPPILLILDNFETPWNADNARSEVMRILQDIEQISHVALLVTMQGNHAPCDGIAWVERKIEALEPEASYQLFTKIHTKAHNDAHLFQLLDTLWHMPLAVTLMARHGKRIGCTAQQLMQSFQMTGIEMLGPREGSDRQNSVTISIEMSVQSGPIKREPDALNLLAVVAMLPAGATLESLRCIWATGIWNLDGTLIALVEAALLEQRDTIFLVHPLIQSYILDPTRLPGHVQPSMVCAACQFLAHHNLVDPGQHYYKAHLAARLQEEINLQAILLETSVPTNDTVHALRILAWHHLRTRPHTEVIEHAVFLARQCSDVKLLAETLYVYGAILEQLGRYQESLKQFTLARQIFLNISNTSRAANISLNIALMSASINSDWNEIPLIQQSLHEFESVGDGRGIIRSLVELGCAHARRNNHTAAITDLTRARQMCVGLCTEGANCALELSISYHQLGQNNAAEIWAKIACDERKELGGDTRDSLRYLGRIYISKGHYDTAIESLTESLKICRAHGGPSWIADVLVELGRVWMKKSDSVRAKAHFTEAVSLYQLIEGPKAWDCIMICVFYLDKLTDPSHLPTLDEVRALRVTSHEEDIPIYYREQ